MLGHIKTFLYARVYSFYRMAVILKQMYIRISAKCLFTKVRIRGD